MLRPFQNSFYFGDAILSHFFRVTTTWTLQLLFQSSYFVRAAAFLRGPFSEQSLSSKQLFFQNSYFFRAKLLASSHFLRIESSPGQLLFGTATFLTRELFRIKISTYDIHFQKSYNFTAELPSQSYTSYLLVF